MTIGFALSGMLTGGLMQADVTAYERSFGLDHEGVSVWLSLFSVLTAMGGVAAGVLSDRFGAGRVYKASLLLSGLGLMSFAAPPTVSTLLGFVIAGLGIGGLVVGNILVSHDNTDSPNRSLNILHGSHGLARLAGVGLSIFVLGILWRSSYLILGMVFLFLAAVYDPPHLHLAESSGAAPSPPASHALLASVGAGFFLYMTAEMVLVTWLAAYFEQDLRWSAAVSKIAYGIFLAGLIGGRFLSAWRWPLELPAPVCRNLAVIHAGAIAAFLIARQPWVLCLSLLVAGWCEGPGWPALFSYAVRRARGHEGKMTSVIYVVCCVGIIFSTAGSGLLAQHAGLRSAFLVVGLAHAAFSVIFYRLLRPA